MLAIGSGSGGGGGFSGAAGTQRGGGGGGGSSGISRLIIPACLIQDTLFVLVPSGGEGGAAGNAGSDGGLAAICLDPTTGADEDTIIRSGTVAATGGGAGTGAAGGAAGAAATVDSATLHSYDKLGSTTFIAGQVGSAGSATGTPGGVTWGSSGIPLSGGVGGAGTSGGGEAAGGALTGGGLMPSLLGGNAATSRQAANGFNGWKPFMFSGGCGGGSDNDSNVSVNGGAGGIGCGGGGGGGGTTGGTGGRGGDGLVVIISW